MNPKLILLSLLSSCAVFAAPLGTAFTYQGRLNDGASPANGNYDLQFVLFDSESGGSQSGPTLTNSNVSVANGLFTTPLDFGAGVFTGSNYWLEISVRTNNVGLFVPLNPRQPLTAAPYAQFAPSAGAAATAASATTASSVGVGAVTSAGLADGAVNSAKIADATIAPADLNLPSFATTFWSVQGNAGTTPGTAFLGTTDNQPLEFRVNNGRAFQLLNTRSNDTVNVLGGSGLNYIDPNLISATIAGGGTPSFNGGPQTNSVGSDFATIGGGAGNRIGTNSNSGLIAGGFGHTIRDNSFDGTIGGGSFHTIGTNTWYSTISGGTGNWLQDNATGATIGGGTQNNVATNAGYAIVGGGYWNTNGGYASVIGGGGQNLIEVPSSYATIGGGLQNLVGTNSPYATIAGGLNNTAASNFVATTISGGQANFAAANHATIGGGLFNTNSGPGATIGGGNNNVTEANDTVIGGGIVNRIGLNSFRATIGGGNLNVISSNSISATIGGGQQNNIATNGSYSTIGGGYSNVVESSSFYTTIAGGVQNTAHSTASYASIGGGWGNSASNGANFAMIPGGWSNSVAAPLAFAAGFLAQANHPGSFVWADSSGPSFASTAPQQFSVRATGGARFETGGAGMTIDGQPVLSGSTGPGSGLNADLLDGLDSTAFATSTHNHYGQTWLGSAAIGLDVRTTNPGPVPGGVAAIRGRQGANAGVYFDTPAGVWGEAESGIGVLGTTSADFPAVWGLNIASNGFASAVLGSSSSASARAIWGTASATNGVTYGIYGDSASSGGVGVYGIHTANTGTAPGVQGSTSSTSANAVGVLGQVTSTSPDSSSAAVRGINNGTGGLGIGVWGSQAGSGYGVYGTAPSGLGVYGSTTSGTGVFGSTTSGTGVSGSASTGAGVNGISTSGIGVRAESSSANIIEGWSTGGGRRFIVDNAGAVHADGAYSSPAADFAEMLPAQDTLEPGDVLVVGEDGKLTRCTQAAQENVVGVYSTKPAFLGGAPDTANLDGKVPLAVVGIVPVKVTNENGAIKPGNLLVASSTAGRAMKAGADPKIGTVIGKALASFDAKDGIVQMLVLQH